MRNLRRFLIGVVAWFGAVGSGISAVTDGRWLRLTTPEFVVVTPLKEKEAVAWTNDFAQYVAALRDYFKAGDLRHLPPLIFVVFGRERDFEGYRPLGLDGKPEPVSGFFNRRESWSVAGAHGTVLPNQMRRSIFHEGVHWFLSGTEPHNPVWLEEGLAEVFSTFEVSGGQAMWGRSIEAHVALLRRGMMPLERLLFTGREELFGQDTKRTGLVYAQSWAFAHYLIFGRHEISAKGISDYAALSLTPIKPDEAFHRAFGKNYGEMEADLKQYIGGGTYLMRRVPLAPFVAPRVEPASALEMEDALGRLALAARRWALAAKHARAVIAAGPGDPRGHELLGFALKESGDTPGALAALTRAEELGSKDAQVYFELGVAEQSDGANPLGELLPLAPAVARRVVDRYKRAIALHPRFQQAYDNIAGVMESAERWGPEDSAVLEAGRRNWPHDASIGVGFAIMARRSGDTARALTLLEKIIGGDAGDASVARAFARRLRDGWQQQDLSETINRLIAEEKFDEVVALVEQELEKGAPAAVRAQLVALLPAIREGVTGKKIERALKEQRWVEARRLITEVLAGESSSAMRTQAQRALADLDRNRLGLEAKKD